MSHPMLMQWRLHATRHDYLTRLERAKKIIGQALSSHRCCLSWSTGKDSTAMVHLVRSIKPDVAIIIQFDDCDWPGKRAYAERTAKAHGWEYHEVRPDFSVWQAALAAGIGVENICSQTHWITKESFLRPLREKQAELQCDCVFLGLRARESRARKLNILKRGPLYTLKDGSAHCLPLAYWSAKDVFAYHVAQKIEINPYYLMNRIANPEDIRLCWAVPTPSSICRDGIEQLRRYYPEQYRRLKDANVI